MKEKKHTALKVLKIISLLLMIIYFIWRLFFTFPTGYGIVAIVFACVLFGCEFMSMLEAMLNLFSTTEGTLPLLPEIEEDMYPEVDVFIATHNESTDILYKTVNGCKHMRYPDKNKVHIWICDDGNRQEMKELADKMNVGWIGLANNKLAKAGNLNNALKKTSAPLIVTFDADMIPTRNFLIKTVPYFSLPKMKQDKDGKWIKRKESEIEKGYEIGFIQTPQNFYNPDVFQYNLYAEDKVPNEQDYFFREINVTRNKSNSPIYAGSNTVILRKALEEVGGIATGTITEDFETGIHIQGKGYRCYATNEVLVHGLAPDTIESLIKQRERWGRGCIYSLRKMHLWTNDEIPFKAKISYFSCKLYWWTFFRRFIFTICPIMYAVFGIPAMVCKAWEIFAFWLPAYLMFVIVQKLCSNGIRTTAWSNIIDTVLFPYLIVPIICEAVGINQSKFVVTRKDKVISDKTDLTLAIPHIMLLFFTLAALGTELYDFVIYKAFGGIVLIFWLAINVYSLLMAVFAMIGRRNLRMNERYKSSVPIELKFDNKKLSGKTVDISEKGMAVVFDKKMVYTPKKAQLSIKTSHYSAKMEVELVYVRTITDAKTKEKIWKYGFKIADISDEDRNEYFQLVYDRDPTLPDYIEETDSIFANISDNILNRTNDLEASRRKLYRIHVDKLVKDDKENDIYMYDYSYKYTALRHSDTKGKQSITITVKEDLSLKCEFVKSLNEEKDLYKVVNSKDVMHNDGFGSMLEKLTVSEGTI